MTITPVDPPLAATEDLLAIWPGYDADTATDAVSFASSLVRGYTGQYISEVAGDVALVTSAGFSATLPQMPVTAIASVEVKSIGLDGTVSWSPITAYDWLPNGTLYCTVPLQYNVMGGPPAWPVDELPGGLRVTYTHGFAVIPTDLHDIVLTIAGDHLTNPSIRRTRYKVGQKDEGWASAAAGVFTPYERAILDRYSISSVR